MKDLVFLKLGGSLITDKHTPHTARIETLERLAEEIKSALLEKPSLLVLLGHGSGSFGHVAGRKYNTRQGVKSRQDWLGFLEVWREARALNLILMDVFSKVDLPVLSFPPSASFTLKDGKIARMNLQPIRAALSAGLIPVTFGDVAFDLKLGGTIISTEEIFLKLAERLKPVRILLAGIEKGVWEDFPLRERLVKSITPSSLPNLVSNLGGSNAVDVTGGMHHKVNSMLGLIRENPGLECLIFSGQESGLLYSALLGENPGTTLKHG